VVPFERGRELYLGRRGVIYDGTERGRWSIIVKVSHFLQFCLVIRDTMPGPSPTGKVDRFRAGTTDAEQLLDLGLVGFLSLVRTTAPSTDLYGRS
jgi:hypothetical protein